MQPVHTELLAHGFGRTPSLLRFGTAYPSLLHSAACQAPDRADDTPVTVPASGGVLQSAWSWVSRLRVSVFTQYSANLPSRMRSVSVPVKVTTVPGWALAPGKPPA